MLLDGQLGLFPEATKDEIKQTKSILSRYRRMKAIISELQREGTELVGKQRTVYNAYKPQVDAIERSVRLILDEEVREIIEMRYIRGERHKITVLHFNNKYHPSTIDRKINEGIKSVANSLKIWA